MFTFPFHIPRTVEQEDGCTPTCVLLHIFLIYVSSPQAGAFKTPLFLDLTSFKRHQDVGGARPGGRRCLRPCLHFPQ